MAKMSQHLRNKLMEARTIQSKAKLGKTLKIVEEFKKSDNKPEWMILEVLPVIPPE